MVERANSLFFKAVTEILNLILDRIEAANPMHGRRLRKQMPAMGPDYISRAQKYFSGFRDALLKEGKSLEFAVDCYLKICNDMQSERLQFLRSGAYANTSYKEVEQTIYSRPDVMEYHMYGLAMAQFLWPDQYQRFSFFCEGLPGYADRIKTYLEIGGGHGLYTKAALEILKSGTRICLLDISETSLGLARRVIGPSPIEFVLRDIFEYEPAEKFDFITIGEVIEHVEKPAEMLAKVRHLLQDDGAVFITTPINAPMIDHIYLFRNAEEIRALLRSCGFQITREKSVPAEQVTEEAAVRNRIPIMYAAFLEKAGGELF